MVARSGEALPRPILLWVRANGRIAGLIALLEKIDAERLRVARLFGLRITHPER